MDPVVHFEMPYEDKQRAADFYGKAFGWQSQMMGPNMGDYVVMTTSEMDPKTRFPTKPGRINGGFFKKNDDPRTHVPNVVIAVDDIHAAIEKVKAAGGTVLGGSQGPDKVDDIPGVGLYVGILDSEGNRVGVIQPKGM